jgi:hypothetical protein
MGTNRTETGSLVSHCRTGVSSGKLPKLRLSSIMFATVKERRLFWHSISMMNRISIGKSTKLVILFASCMQKASNFLMGHNGFELRNGGLCETFNLACRAHISLSMCLGNAKRGGGIRLAKCVMSQRRNGVGNAKVLNTAEGYSQFSSDWV